MFLPRDPVVEVEAQPRGERAGCWVTVDGEAREVPVVVPAHPPSTRVVAPVVVVLVLEQWTGGAVGTPVLVSLTRAAVEAVVLLVALASLLLGIWRNGLLR